MITDCTKNIIKYGHLKGVGKKYLVSVLKACAHESMSVEEYFSREVGGSRKHSNAEVKEAEVYSERQVAEAERYGHKIISMVDHDYPDSLKWVFDPPPILYCAGDVRLLQKDSITIIGTRSPTMHGSLIGERVTSSFCANGWVITSGLAKGVDAIAHQACIDAGGRTIAVLAHGLEKIYPAANKELAKRIIETGGLLVSEYGYKSFVGKSNFVERDRIQAALSKGVVLVQSDLRGGSLHASKAALRYGRYLVVLGQSVQDRLNQEPKIAANMVLAEGDNSAKAELLGVSLEEAGNIVYLRDKDLLLEVSDKLKNVSFRGEYISPSDLFKS